MDSKDPEKISAHLVELRRQLGLPDQVISVEEKKDQQEKTIAYGQKIWEEKIYPQFSFDDLMQLVKNAGYIVDEENEEIVKKVCLYFSGDERMKESGITPEKGICLIGQPGVGKTWLMKIMKNNSHNPFALINCFQIADECEKGGSEGISRHFKKIITARPDLYSGKKEIGCCFNELGRETIPVKYFGNPVNVMEKILFTRYESGMAHNLTHITTNKIPNQIEEMYGDYIRDRMREMFNVLIFPSTAKSRRK